MFIENMLHIYMRDMGHVELSLFIQNFRLLIE